MKKIVFLMCFIIMVSGCKNSDKKVTVKEPSVKKEVIEETYKDDNQIIVGIYENDKNLVHDYHTKRENNKDIVFGIYYTNDEVLENRNQKYNWNKYYNNYTNIDNYKIGFHFSFYSGNNKIEKTITKPEIFAFNPYFYIYLYDDINQPDNTFYSHIEEGNVADNTIFSSIKIYLVTSEEITSPIEFTAFTYNGLDDFDQDNNYRGNSKYTININLD